MADKGEPALNLPVPLAHDHVLLVMGHDKGGHEPGLPFLSGRFVSGGAQGLSQKSDGIFV